MSPTKEKPTLGRSYRSKTFVGPTFSELELGRFIHFQYKRLLNRNIYNLSTNLLVYIYSIVNSIEIDVICSNSMMYIVP